MKFLEDGFIRSSLQSFNRLYLTLFRYSLNGEHTNNIEIAQISFIWANCLHVLLLTASSGLTHSDVLSPDIV